MHQNLSRLAMRATLGLAALLGPALYGQTTCNGLPATIVATATGQVMGTPGDDVIVGTAGDDRIFGLGGNDTICALGGNDQITGGDGNDSLFGEAGDDTFFWFPGDDNDRVEGASESDTLQVAGSIVSETVDLSANGARLRFFRNIANIVLDVAGVERVHFEARGGADLIVVNRLVGTGVQQVTVNLENFENSNTPDGEPDSVIVFGGTGNDQITVTGTAGKVNITGAGPAIEIRNPEATFDSLSVDGMAGNDQITAQGLAAGLIMLTLQGGPGNDTLTGSQARDVLAGGDDNDAFVWTLGLPADLVAGDAGVDTLQVLGSTSADNVVLSPIPLGINVFNVNDGAALDADVEEVTLQTGRGVDQITVSTLAGTTLQKITLDLRATATGTAGDGAADALVVNGTSSADSISITGSAGNLTLSGLAPTILVQGSEGTRDTLTVIGGLGIDAITAQGLAADVIRLILRGGDGDDILTGSAGDDLFQWQPGDDNDVIEGGPGINDALQFAGASISETISLTANGPRLRFTRDIASVVLDVNAVERVTFAAQGGSDTISFGDLNGTTVKQVAVDLTSPGNSAGDGQPDTILIAALSSRPITTTLGVGTMRITWSPVTISVTGVEPTNDRLILQTLTGPPPAIISSAPEPASTEAGEAGSGVARR